MISTFVANFILASVSVVSIFRLHFTGQRLSGHFQIDFGKKTDYRTVAIAEIIAINSVVSFFHSGDLWASIRSLGSKVSPIYIESIAQLVFTIVWPVYLYRTSLRRRGDILSEMISREIFYGNVYLSVSQFVFRQTRIERLLVIDDPRNVATLCLAARNLSVRTIGYMHGKFNSFHVGLTVIPFDRYLVWNPYFAAKIRELWGGSYPGAIHVVGLIRKDVQAWISKYDTPLSNVLWLEEDETPMDQMHPYLQAIKNDFRLSIIVRAKPRAGLHTDLAHLGCKMDTTSSFYESVVTHRPFAVIGCHSTALIEAHLFGITPISIKTDLDYGHELIDDKVVLSCDGPESLLILLQALIARPLGGRTLSSCDKFIEPFLPGSVSEVLAKEGFSIVVPSIAAGL